MPQGRKSPNATQLRVAMEPWVPGAQPPAPPEELGLDEMQEWKALTTRMPPNWFPPESWPLLVQLCRHICQARWFGQCLQEIRAGCMGTLHEHDFERVALLCSLHNRESRAMQSLMVKLRLTHVALMPRPESAFQARTEIPDLLPWQSGDTQN